MSKEALKNYEIGLLQCNEELWIHIINAICTCPLSHESKQKILYIKTFIVKGTK